MEVKVKVYSLWHLEMSLYKSVYSLHYNAMGMGDCSYNFEILIET